MSLDNFEEGEVEENGILHINLCPDATFKGPISCMSWGGGDRITFATNTASGPVVHDMKFGILAGDLRKLLHGWHNIFTHLNEKEKTFGQDRELRLHHVCVASRHYRAELQDLLHKCQERIEDHIQMRRICRKYSREYTNEFHEEYLQYCSLLETAKVAWHLAEIFFFDVNFNVTSQFVNWFQSSEPLPVIENNNDEDEFWRVLYRLTMQGRIDDALALLNSNVALLFGGGDSEEVTLVKELLESIPSILSQTNRSWDEKEFQENFATWHLHIQGLLSNSAIVSSPPIQKLLQILAGDTASHLEFADVWSELLVARLLFVDPSAGKDRIIHYARACQNEICDRDGDLSQEAVPFHQLLFAIMMEDSDVVIHQVHQIFEAPWLTAHLADLMYHAELLQPVIISSVDHQDVRLRDEFLLEYSCEVMAHPSLWQIAVNYLGTCSVRGLHFLKHLVARQPVRDMKTGHKLMDICDRFDLMDEKTEIQRSLGLKYLKQNQYGTAIHWYIQARDMQMIGIICDDILEKHLASEDGDMSEIESIVENIGEIPICNELGFMCKYRELMLLMEELRAGSAKASEAYEMTRGSLEIIIRLLDSQVAPHKFWVLLLRQAMILLEGSSDVILSSEDISKLMSCLEQVIVSHRSNAYISEEHVSEISLLRLSLGNHLVNSFVDEMSISEL